MYPNRNSKLRVTYFIMNTFRNKKQMLWLISLVYNNFTRGIFLQGIKKGNTQYKIYTFNTILLDCEKSLSFLCYLWCETDPRENECGIER